MLQLVMCRLVSSCEGGGVSRTARAPFYRNPGLLMLPESPGGVSVLQARASA
ncbi:MAG: hypothetical protein GX536_03115 [Actinobacteria bacterium]|nr:hypothetical protein [Actinomycetota bacterium]